MLSLRPRFKLVLLMSLVLVILDQATKIWVVNSLPYGTSREVIPGFFNLTYVLNYGSAFGFLNDPSGDWQRYFFIGVSFAALGVILFLVHCAKEDERTLIYGLGLLLGGSLGNMIDRVRQGPVIDFLDIYVNQWHWPAFNVADSAISVGACVLIISFYRKENSADVRSAP